uniref:Uncharacterized protein n=1 Tax=Anguilla anguilla TaxID=7936 RepID=A0A0E9PI45_ANGAN
MGRGGCLFIPFRYQVCPTCRSRVFSKLGSRL